MAVSYDYYRIFYFVAKYHSFTRAAEVLFANQPNITRAMNNLEAELGCRLFLRSNRGVTLTPEGEKLFSHVRIAQEHLQAGEMELSGDKSLESGFVSIGASETALHRLLLPVLRRFHLTYPGIRIQISSYSTPQAINALKNGLIELAVVTTPTGLNHSSNDICLETALQKFHDIVIAGPSFGALKGKTLTLQQLSQYPLICMNHHSKTYEQYNKLFAKYNLILQPDIEAATTDQILPMVKYDLGLGILPDNFATAAIEQHEVFQIQLKEALPVRLICLVKDRTRPLSIAAGKLEEMIRTDAP